MSLIILMKQFAKQHLMNKLPKLAMDATLLPEAVSKLTLSQVFVCNPPPQNKSYLPSECPLSLCVAWGLCVCLSEYYFYSIIIYCSGELMLAAQVINQPVMRPKAQQKTGCCSCGPHPVQGPIKPVIRKNMVSSCYHMPF